MPLAEQIIETVQNANGMSIFTMMYKVGAVLKTQNFFAQNETDAREKAERFVAFMAGRDNSKVMLVGKVRPFALDIDKEISRLSGIDATPNIYPM